jgi:hypothetical protein
VPLVNSNIVVFGNEAVSGAHPQSTRVFTDGPNNSSKRASRLWKDKKFAELDSESESDTEANADKELSEQLSGICLVKGKPTEVPWKHPDPNSLPVASSSKSSSSSSLYSSSSSSSPSPSSSPSFPSIGSLPSPSPSPSVSRSNSSNCLLDAEQLRELTDEEILEKIRSKELPEYLLENKLGDLTRAVKIRRMALRKFYFDCACNSLRSNFN